MNAPATFRYRAVRDNGEPVHGEIAAATRAEALDRIRRLGASPLELAPLAAGTAKPGGVRRNQAAVTALLGELAVLLRAGLPLDRALALATGNIEHAATAAAVAELGQALREGAPLSAAMRAHPGLFTPGDAAMAEAGEANGRLAEALERLAAMREAAAELRRTVISAMIYPAALLVIAIAVILMMLLFVVPQFERLLAGAHGDLPAASLVVIGASRALREHGWWAAPLLVAAGFAARAALLRPSAREWRDAAILATPQLGELVRRIEAARFANTFGALLEGGVPLPPALALAARTVGNSAIAGGIATVAEGVREGGSLSRLLAQVAVLPPLALGFVRTGEETSRLPHMLTRLALVLERDARTRLERLIAVLTPLITVALGAVVAGIVASVMSAILGFNDLAIAQ